MNCYQASGRAVRVKIFNRCSVAGTGRKQSKYGLCWKGGGGVQTWPKCFGELFFKELYILGKCPRGVVKSGPFQNIWSTFKGFYSVGFPKKSFVYFGYDIKGGGL